MHQVQASSVGRAFVPPVDPKEAVTKWSRQIRSEGRAIDRSIRGALPRLFISSEGRQEHKVHRLPVSPWHLCQGFANSDARVSMTDSPHCMACTEIEREKKKAERQIKQHAKEGNVSSAKVSPSCWLAWFIIYPCIL